jgi:hypothetical protein
MDIIEKIKAWVKENYKQHTTGWTYEKSEGNYADCFDDGMECGTSWAAYMIGQILDMDFEEPDEEDD